MESIGCIKSQWPALRDSVENPFICRISGTFKLRPATCAQIGRFWGVISTIRANQFDRHAAADNQKDQSWDYPKRVFNEHAEDSSDLDRETQGKESRLLFLCGIYDRLGCCFGFGVEWPRVHSAMGTNNTLPCSTGIKFHALAAMGAGADCPVFRDGFCLCSHIMSLR